jgi:hypothetical protein
MKRLGTHTIEVDDEVFAELKRDAEPFIDTPNTVLRRHFDLPPLPADAVAAPAAPSGGGKADRRRRGERGGRKRAPAGALMPENEYEIPILRALDKEGGRAATQEVVAAVGAMVKGKLTELDQETMGDGKRPRWQMRVQFARLRMVERGWIASGSPRGIWEITDAGRAHLKAAA